MKTSEEYAGTRGQHASDVFRFQSSQGQCPVVSLINIIWTPEARTGLIP